MRKLSSPPGTVARTRPPSQGLPRLAVTSRATPARTVPRRASRCSVCSFSHACCAVVCVGGCVSECSCTANVQERGRAKQSRQVVSSAHIAVLWAVHHRMSSLADSMYRALRAHLEDAFKPHWIRQGRDMPAMQGPRPDKSSLTSTSAWSSSAQAPTSSSDMCRLVWPPAPSLHAHSRSLQS